MVSELGQSIKQEADVESVANDRLERIQAVLANLQKQTTEPQSGMYTELPDTTEEKKEQLVAVLQSLERGFGNVQQLLDHHDDVPPMLTEEQLALYMDTIGQIPYFILGLHGRTFTKADLLQEGYLALVNAVRLYDPELGTDFRSYARKTVRGTVLRCIRDRDRLVKLPRKFFERNTLITEASQQIEQRGEKPTDKEIAEMTGLDVDYVSEERRDYHLTEFVPILQGRSDGDNIKYIDIPDDRIEASIEMVDDRLLLGELFSLLSPIEREIICARFGFPPYERPHSQTEIADARSISQVHARRIIRRAVEKMRDYLEETS